MSEDNCVLDEIDLKLIQEYINTVLLATKGFSKLNSRSLEIVKKTADKIYQKIIKLNDLAKNNKIQEKINDDNHVYTGEPPF